MVFVQHYILNGFNNNIAYDNNNMKSHLIADYKLLFEEAERNNEKINCLINDIGSLEAQRKDCVHKLTGKPYDDYAFHEQISSLDGKICKFKEQLNLLEWNSMKRPTELSDKELYEFFGKQEFHDCLMINISPKWVEGVEGLSEGGRIKFLKLVIEKFITSGSRFTRYKFVIECGKDGNHIHAHCVMMLNPELNKSNKTWISKGNVSRDLRAVWNKLSRDAQLLQEDCLKSKFAIQTILIKNERMLQDKLDYLIEELKPLSHQNLPHPQLPEISGEW
jgi:uncharacterized coiled-coil protein SlyX